MSPSFNVTIRSIAQGGDGVGVLPDGRICFVPFTLPGETVSVHPRKNKKRWVSGDIISVITPSADRIPPQCDHFQTCGGCSFWHTPYPHELTLKTDAALHNLHKIAKIPFPEPHIIAAKPTEHYRNRASFHVRGHQIGFFESRSNRLVDIATCPILDSRLQNSLTLIRSHLKKSPPLKEGTLFIESASPTTTVATLHLPNERIYQDALYLGASLFPTTSQHSTRCSPLQGLRVQQNRRTFNDFGDLHINPSEAISSLSSTIPSLTFPTERFRQNHPQMNDVMVSYIVSLAKQFHKPRIVECFCGSGNFTFALRSLASSLVAYDVDIDAITIGKALENSLPSHDFPSPSIQWRCENLLFEHSPPPSLLHELAAADLILLDPPRAGAKTLMEHLPTTTAAILYVSCDPATFSRDAEILFTKGYSCKKLTFMDLFPRTSHIETIALFLPNNPTTNPKPTTP